MRRYIKILCSSRRGNAMLEFALSAAVLLPAFAGTFQYGYTFFTYNKLQSAIRGGARYASMRTYDSSTSTPSTAFTTAVKNMVVYGNSAGTGLPLAPGLDSSNVEVLPNMSGSIPQSMTVRITGYQVDAVFSKFTFNAKPSTTFIYTGTPSPL
jgi:Flp pilus assembly protein TadG